MSDICIIVTAIFKLFRFCGTFLFVFVFSNPVGTRNKDSFYIRVYVNPETYALKPRIIVTGCECELFKTVWKLRSIFNSSYDNTEMMIVWISRVLAYIWVLQARISVFTNFCALFNSFIVTLYRCNESSLITFRAESHYSEAIVCYVINE